MRRLLLLMAGFGLARLLFWRRPAPAPPPGPAAPEVDPRAEALRAKLEAGEAGAVEPATAEPAPPPGEPDADERRRRVHEAARATVEEMRASGGESVDDESV